MTLHALNESKAHADTQAAYAALCDHKDTSPFRAVAEWIDALASQQLALMKSCSRDKLPDCQIRLRQLAAMSAALQYPAEAGNGHVFD